MYKFMEWIDHRQWRLQDGNLSITYVVDEHRSALASYDIRLDTYIQKSPVYTALPYYINIHTNPYIYIIGPVYVTLTRQHCGYMPHKTSDKTKCNVYSYTTIPYSIYTNV